MLEAYLSAIKTVWEWAKTFFVALVVMLPSVLVLAYEIATWNEDISPVTAGITLAVNLLWAPIPLYRRYSYKYNGFADYYTSFLLGTGLTLLVVPMVFAYVGGCFLPALAGVLYCHFTDYTPSGLQFMTVIVVTALWAPGANHLMMKFMDRIFGSHGGT